MNNPLAVQTQKGMATLTPANMRLIKQTLARDTNDQEFDLYVEMCRLTGLNPIRKQIYAVVYNANNDRRQMVIITSIDGFRAIAARNGDYRPADEEPEVIYKEDLIDPKRNPKGIERAIYKAWKRDVHGEWFPVVGVAHWESFAPMKDVWENVDGRNQKTGESELDPKANFWWKMPEHMIAKCAESQALRRGWPEDLSGVYTSDEMAQADAAERTATELMEEFDVGERLKRIGGSNAVPLTFEYGGNVELVPLGQVGDRIMSYLEDASVAEIATFKDRNAQGLNQYWALDKAEAFEIKKAIEAKIGAEGAPHIDMDPIDDEAEVFDETAEAPAA